MASSDLPRSAAGPNSPWLLAVVVSIATFMEVLDTTIANVALRHIAGSLAAGQDESTYILTSYLVSNAIVLPISGWLSNVVGRKRFYMSCVALFTISSVACAFATSLWMMLVFRVFQGIGGGGLAPTEQSIFADSFTPKQRALAFSLYGFTVVTAPAIGPVLGGWLTDSYSWHWVFLINLPVGALSLVLTWLFVYDSEQVRADRRRLLKRGLRIDYIGFVLVALCFGCLQIVLDRFEREDGFSSTTISTLSIISGVSLVALIVWELTVEQPVVNLRLFRIPAFAISNAVMFSFGFIIISTTQLLPQLTQELLGYDATTAGLTLGLGGIVSLFVMPISGLVTGRLIQPKWLIAAALIGTFGALQYASGLNLQMSFWNASLSRMLQVFWLPFIFIPLSAVQFVGVPPQQNPDASAIINLMRNLGGSFGVSLVTTELQWRNQFHHVRLGEHVTPYDGFTAGPLGNGLNAIAGVVQQQATILSYLDVFTLLSFIALAAFPLALFLPNLPKGKAAGGH
jgi:DHA2 family multidrug resistance protein